MSIRDEIQHRTQEGRLFCLAPLIPSIAVVRTLFVSQEINAVANPPWPQTTEGLRFSEMRAYLDAWTAGQLISVALDPYKKPKSTFLARIDPIVDEVWDIRCIDPKPGLRVLGAFAEQDVFIALTHNFRENLENDKAWRDEIQRCKVAWKNLFPTYPRHSGDDVNDYLSNNFHLV